MAPVSIVAVLFFIAFISTLTFFTLRGSKDTYFLAFLDEVGVSHKTALNSFYGSVFLSRKEKKRIKAEYGDSSLLKPKKTPLELKYDREDALRDAKYSGRCGYAFDPKEFEDRANGDEDFLRLCRAEYLYAIIESAREDGAKNRDLNLQYKKFFIVGDSEAIEMAESSFALGQEDFENLKKSYKHRDTNDVWDSKNSKVDF